MCVCVCVCTFLHVVPPLIDCWTDAILCWLHTSEPFIVFYLQDLLDFDDVQIDDDVEGFEDVSCGVLNMACKCAW